MNWTKLFKVVSRYNQHSIALVALLKCRFVKSFSAATMSSDVFSSGSSDSNWRGVPLSELYGSQSPWGAPEFPLVSPGHNHAVLYHIPGSGMVGDRPPKPQIGHDKWDQEHVRMPCSSHSLYPVEDGNGDSHLKKRWEIIEHALWRPIRNSKELADAILSYNTKFKTNWKFRALHKLFDEYLEEEESQYFFDVTLPEIAKLALALPKLIQSPIPLLKQHKNISISLSQQQIASLLANAFFCTFPRRNTTKRTSEYASYPFINFNRLYESSGSEHVLEKLKCICHYFRRVCTKGDTIIRDGTVGPGVVTFSRRSVRPASLPAWPDSGAPLASLPLHVDPDTTIEEADGLIQVDFANKFLGGGVLNTGCVQEEIRFVISPELLVSMLFTEVLRPNEALLIIGTERYSTYSGYGHSFQWTGDCRDATPLDSSHRRRCAVLAIDAHPYSGEAHEYRRDMIARELNKAWIGFSFATDPTSPSLNYPGVATGNWGCGAFGGTPQLKSLLQMMACVQARRPMAYYTFKDVTIRDDVVNIYNLLARYNVTVGQLYKYIIRFSESGVRHTQLHSFLHQILRDGDKQPPTKGNAPTASLSEGDKAITLSDDTNIAVSSNGHGNDEAILKDEGSKSEDQGKNAENCAQQAKDCEGMDISTSSDVSVQDISYTTAIQHAVPKDSPDIFCSLEYDEFTLTEVKVLKNEAITKVADNSTQRPSRLIEAMEKLDDNESTHQESAKEINNSPRPSRLFEEMQKLDEQSGKLNLSVTNTSPFKFTNVQNNDANASMDGLNSSKIDATTEMKKRVSRKITDYFIKQPT